MSRGVILDCGTGIGDIIWGTTIVDALNRAERGDHWYGFLKFKHYWTVLLTENFRWPVFIRGHTPRSIWRRLSTQRMQPGMGVLEFFGARARALLDWDPGPVPMPARPAYFGPPVRRGGGRIGVFVPTRQRPKYWRRAAEFAESARAIGAEPMPIEAAMHAREVLDWIAGCRAFVSSETGLAHLAIAVGVPTLLVLGRRFAPGVFAGAGVVEVIDGECPLGFAPCMRWVRAPACVGSWDPKNPPFPCLATTSIAAVRAGLERLLDETAAEAGAWRSC